MREHRERKRYGQAAGDVHSPTEDAVAHVERSGLENHIGVVAVYPTQHDPGLCHGPVSYMTSNALTG